jgi:transcriptional regulator with XRE-family HTH domain
MDISPFGQTLFLWRLKRDLSQAELARRARIPRPNLSAIERGRREVTLGTLRALALALDVRPGVLADGALPLLWEKKPTWSRASLERIADAAVFGKKVAFGFEQDVADLLRCVTREISSTKRKAAVSWLRLKSACPPEVLRSLLQRIRDRERIYDKRTD